MIILDHFSLFPHHSLTQLAPFLRRIARGVSDEDALDVLEDLNETSKKRHEILEFFVSHSETVLLWMVIRRGDLSYDDAVITLLT